MIKSEIQLPCVSRRHFLLTGAAAVTTVTLGSLFGDRVFAGDAGRQATLYSYPKKWIGKIAELTPDDPQVFMYPREDAYSLCSLYKLGAPAGGGAGPDRDIVAFSDLCTHQGGLLRGNFDRRAGVAGPCPIHLTTFDLRRHGIVVSGHATLSLPQIVLETQGADIYATAVLGLLYGLHDNLERRG